MTGIPIPKTPRRVRSEEAALAPVGALGTALAVGFLIGGVFATIGLVIWLALDLLLDGRLIGGDEIAALFELAGAVGIGATLAEYSRGDRQ